MAVCSHGSAWALAGRTPAEGRLLLAEGIESLLPSMDWLMVHCEQSPFQDKRRYATRARLQVRLW